MVVGGSGGGTVHIGGLDMPGGRLVDDTGVIAFVAGAGAWTLVEWERKVFLFDEVHGDDVTVRGVGYAVGTL
jgi:hypothetical protein